eukprot:scaffold91_cov19-Tisochrysis_lutea.AAC.1
MSEVRITSCGFASQLWVLGRTCMHECLQHSLLHNNSAAGPLARNLAWVPMNRHYKNGTNFALGLTENACQKLQSLILLNCLSKLVELCKLLRKYPPLQYLHKMGVCNRWSVVLAHLSSGYLQEVPNPLPGPLVLEVALPPASRLHGHAAGSASLPSSIRM